MAKKRKLHSKPTLVDIYSGAGANAEGFRQEGFKVLLGVDNWQPAVDTFKYNQKAKCLHADVLDLTKTVELIESSIPDSMVITGSPPCVSFSSSNRSGKADKSLGKKLMRAFLKIVVVKRYKKGSKLQAWYMENVGKSAKHVKSSYTFKDLGLSVWAREIGKRPDQVAIRIKANSNILNAADYGAPQMRKRLFVGEIFDKEKAFPNATHGVRDNMIPYVTLRKVRTCLPPPNAEKHELNFIVSDPNHTELTLPASKLTDHFYDTGLHSHHWQRSRFLKVNHPFMGKMSFPEKEDRPARTVMATNIGSSRESIVLKCERGRVNDGEYRTLTVRESACLMGFPITYQFLGSSASKVKLVGNAVCPQVSRALARHLRSVLGMPKRRDAKVRKTFKLNEKVINLNDHKERTFKEITLPQGSKFRRHLFKDGNLTVELTNFDLLRSNGAVNGKWRSFILYSNGEGYQKKAHEIKENYFRKLEPVILRHLPSGKRFIKVINNGFSERIPHAQLMQALLERTAKSDDFYPPAQILTKINEMINDHCQEKVVVIDEKLPFKKEQIPLKQILALYAINKVISVTNATCE